MNVGSNLKDTYMLGKAFNSTEGGSYGKVVRRRKRKE